MIFMDISDKSMVEMLPEANRRLELAMLELMAAAEVKLKIEREVLIATLSKKKITINGIVLVNFSSGEERCLYEGLSTNTYTQKTNITLRHFTKKGKPMKTASLYGTGITGLMRSAKSNNS